MDGDDEQVQKTLSDFITLKTFPEQHKCVCMSNCSVCFLFTGGRYVKVWDVLKGGQLLVSLKNHHKTVTCLCLNSSGQRLLSGSLDRLVYLWLHFYLNSLGLFFL